LLKGGWDFKRYLILKNHLLTEKDDIEWWMDDKWCVPGPDGAWTDLATPPKKLSLADMKASNVNNLWINNFWKTNALEFMKKNNLTAPELHSRQTVNFLDDPNHPKYPSRGGKLIWRYSDLSTYAEKIKGDFSQIGLVLGFCLLWLLLKLWCRWLVKI